MKKNIRKKVLEAMQSAQQEAALRYHQEITSAHVLAALIKEPEGLLATIFSECRVDLPMLKAKLEQMLKKIPSVKGQSRLGMSTEMVRVLGRAAKLAENMKTIISVRNICCWPLSATAMMKCSSCAVNSICIRIKSCPLLKRNANRM